MMSAFEAQWNDDLLPVWHVERSIFKFYKKNEPIPADSWWIVFLNDSDQAQALAYHDLTTKGFPLSKVFVRTIKADGASVSVGASHELCEMAVDPWLNGAYQDDRGVFWASEICDPVEDDQYGYVIKEIRVSDFVTPNWYAHKFAQGPIDFKGHAQAAFEVLTGGYAQRFSDTGWVQVTGSKASMTAMATPQPGSRRERRMRPSVKWERSKPADRMSPVE
jgi:hypothetical protein